MTSRKSVLVTTNLADALSAKLHQLKSRKSQWQDAACHREKLPPCSCMHCMVLLLSRKRSTLNNSRIVPQHTSFSLISDFVRESRLPSRYAKSKKQSTMAARFHPLSIEFSRRRPRSNTWCLLSWTYWCFLQVNPV